MEEKTLSEILHFFYISGCGSLFLLSHPGHGSNPMMFFILANKPEFFVFLLKLEFLQRYFLALIASSVSRGSGRIKRVGARAVSQQATFICAKKTEKENRDLSLDILSTGGREKMGKLPV